MGDEYQDLGDHKRHDPLYQEPEQNQYAPVRKDQPEYMEPVAPGRQPPAPPVRMSTKNPAPAPTYPIARFDSSYTYPATPPSAGTSATSGDYANDIAETVRDISRDEADAILRKERFKEGDYVIRKSTSHPGSYVLCVSAGGKSLHYPVELQTDAVSFSVLCPGPRRTFNSLQQVITFYTKTQEGLAAKLVRRLA